MSRLYWFLCIPGLVLPYSAFAPWVMEHGLAPGPFVAELFSTRIGAFFGWDVIVSALVLLSFAAAEARRIGWRAFWFTALAVCLAGVSLGLPLLLALREARTRRMPDG